MRIVILALAVAACSKAPPPETQPVPVEVSITSPDGTTRTEIVRVEFVPVPEDVYVDMTVAAAGWAKGSIGRSVGVYQPDNAPPLFLRAVQAVTQRYALRPISRSDFAVVCGGAATKQTSITRTTNCTMKHVDAVLSFNSVRMTRDSGYVGTSVTRVPAGSNRPERTYYCITLVRKNGAWEATRGDRIVEAIRCPRGWA